MKKEFDVCDVCEDPARPIKTYTVTSGDRDGSTDRCDEHGAPFEAVLSKNSRTPAAPSARPAKRRGGRAASRVMSIDEIEATKRR